MPVSGTGWYNACIYSQDWNFGVHLFNMISPKLPTGLSYLKHCGSRPRAEGFTTQELLFYVSQQEYRQACNRIRDTNLKKLELLAQITGLLSVTDVLDKVFKCGYAHADDPRIIHSIAEFSTAMDGFVLYADAVNDMESAIEGSHPCSYS